MSLQRLATGATGVKQARYRRMPTRGSEALYAHAHIYTACWMHGVFYGVPRVLHFSAFIICCVSVVCESVCWCFLRKYNSVCSIQSLILCYSLPMTMLEPSDSEEKEPSPSTSPVSPQPPLDPTEPEYNQPTKLCLMILLTMLCVL